LSLLKSVFDLQPILPMFRLLPFSIVLFLSLTNAHSGETGFSGFASSSRSTILATVHPEFARVRPCGLASGPSGYSVDHLALEDEWACIAGSAVYHCSPGPFAVKFIALLKWNCGGWKVISNSFDADRVTRRQFVGMRQVPPAILPRWIRWSR